MQHRQFVAEGINTPSPWTQLQGQMWLKGNRGQTGIFASFLLYCLRTDSVLLHARRFAMPRPPRYALPGIPQHVLQRGNNRQPVFFCEDDYRCYLASVKRAAAQHAIAVHAYVLMTNHVHLLVTPQQANGIAKLMQSIGRRYVQYINATYQRTGTLWEGRYRASLVDVDRYFFLCARYIELNPVRAAMVAHPAAYPWSSYRWHACGELDAVLTDHDLYQALGHTPHERQVAYRAMFHPDIAAGVLQEIRTTVHQCRVLGSERFKDVIERVLARRIRPGKAGRPRHAPSLPTARDRTAQP